jgi:hypothetical protein
LPSLAIPKFPDVHPVVLRLLFKLAPTDLTKSREPNEKTRTIKEKKPSIKKNKEKLNLSKLYKRFIPSSCLLADGNMKQ